MASSKNLSIKVNFRDQVKLFICKRQELEQKISSHFKINVRDFKLFSVVNHERQQISLHEIQDFMKIEIVPPINEQQTSQELDAFQKIIESITSKLRQNTPLSGQERKILLEAIEKNGMSLFRSRKRKLESDDVCGINAPERVNKKVQVQVSLNNKDSFAQTDPVPHAFDVDNSIVNNEDTDKDHQLTLKRLMMQDEVNKDLIEELMDKTYERRRNFIHKGPSVSVIKEEYPALFCVDQVKKELDRLFYPGKSEEFLRNINVYSQLILYYKSSKTADINLIIEKAVSHAKTAKQKTYAEMVGSIFVLAKLLDETFGFIHLCDYPISEKMEEYDYPYINATKCKLRDIFSDKIHYDIIVEDELLCEASNFCEAILCLMASFFIFKIVYPTNCCNTLLVLERLYAGAIETEEVDPYTDQFIKFFKEKAVSKKKRVVP